MNSYGSVQSTTQFNQEQNDVLQLRGASSVTHPLSVNEILYGTEEMIETGRCDAKTFAF